MVYFRQSGDLTRLANVLNNLGVLHHHRGDYEQAVDLLAQALEIARKSGYTRMEAFVRAGLGDIYLDLKAESAASAEYKQARQLAQQLNLSFLLFHLDLAEAALANLTGNSQKAFTLIAAAEGRISSNGPAHQIGQCKLQQGITYLSTGNIAMANAVLAESVDWLGKVKGQPDTGRAHLYLAITHHKMGKVESAIQHAQVALSFVRNVDDQHLLVMIGAIAAPLLQNLAFDPVYGVLAANLLAGITEFFEHLTAFQRRVREISPGAAFAPPQIAITTLGLTELRIGEQIIPNSTWYSKVQREMFFYILAHPKGVSQKSVESVLWPNNANPQVAFHNTLYNLRKKVGTETIVYQDNRYFFNQALDYQYDVEIFEAHERQARAATDPDEKARHYRQMMALYQGHYFIDASETWAGLERERLRQVWLNAAQNLVQFCLDMEIYAEALHWSLHTLKTDSSLEKVHCLAMRAYAGLGDRVSVERQFDWCQQAMQEHYKTQPSIDTLLLYRSLTR